VFAHSEATALRIGVEGVLMGYGGPNSFSALLLSKLFRQQRWFFILFRYNIVHLCKCGEQNKVNCDILHAVIIHTVTTS